MAVQHFSEFLWFFWCAGLTCFLNEAFAKFRPCMTVQEKEDAYKTVFLLLSAALLLPGIRGFKVGPPIDKKGTRGYEFGIAPPAFGVWPISYYSHSRQRRIRGPEIVQVQRLQSRSQSPLF
jgi:hypothetical protein